MKIFKAISGLVLMTFCLCSCKHDNNHDETQKDYHQTAVTEYKVVDSITYAFRRLGKPGSKMPLILIESLGSSMDDWDPAITNGLAQHGEVILFDLQGVGRTSGKAPASVSGFAKGVTAFVKAMGYSKVNVLGFSMGSFISQELALTQPEMINKIILTGTGPKGAIGLSELPTLLGQAATLSPEEAFLKFGFSSSTNSTNAGKLSYERIQRRTVDRDLPLTQETGLAELTAVLGWAQSNPEGLNELRRVTHPVLIAQGENDLPVPVQNAKNMAAALPNSTLVIYPDSGHAALFQNWEAFVKSVGDFLKQ